MSSFAYLAYHNYTTYSNPSIIYSPFSNLWKGYLAAGLLASAIMPYTLAFMMGGVNKHLHDAHHAEEHERMEERVLEPRMCTICLRDGLRIIL